MCLCLYLGLCMWEQHMKSRIKTPWWSSRGITEGAAAELVQRGSLAFLVHLGRDSSWHAWVERVPSFRQEVEKSSTLLSRIFFVFTLCQSRQLFANELPNWVTRDPHVLSSHYYQMTFIVLPSFQEKNWICHTSSLMWFGVVRARLAPTILETAIQLLR